ncbi:flavin-binding monooxygenase-like protein [Amniculicola lignicola CBS 123094]|uniref:Flavin-binding monooxygenase-like protein n=1 Tax=Amniculicola lignicola CBS 123094 TaxID=1392246 RepID=A0A6A5WVQ9_9PLEO|nr:flavin-binding monooxygenase-like protein [Amniculicola lignicola CBS 123094]
MGVSQPWHKVPVGNKTHTSAAIVIIGAGISGMCMAIDLIKRNQCHNFIIVEKSSGIGGTWNDNKYPGCCCDVWSMLYSYSFEQNPDWTREYPGQEEILDYLRNVANKYQLYKYIRFNTSVDAATWDDTKSIWKINVNVTGGKDAEFSPNYTIECDFLVSAVGQLNQPRYPTIEGLQNFKGKVMHSARWDWSYNLEEKSVGIIGNGATAAQIIPEILPASSHLVIYQRSPNWVIPRMDGPVSALRRAIYKYIPPIRWRIRAMQMDYREAFHSAVFDNDSQFADMIRDWCKSSLQAQIPDRPGMWEKLTPDYSPGCKRVIISDDYYPALASPKTTLETQRIIRVTETGVEVANNQGETTHHAHDTLVLATGFRTVEFLHPIKITGSRNRPLSEIWGKGASALYGTTVPSLPNFGMFYGPNTNLGHNSIVLMIEAQSRYLNTLVSAVLDARSRGARIGIQPKEQRTEEFNTEIQTLLEKSSFADPKCGSWYKNEAGKITNNWSGTVVEYQDLLSTVNWEDFEVVESEGGDGVYSKVEGGERKSASKVVFGSGRNETNIGRVHEETSISGVGLVAGMASVIALGTLWQFRNRLPKRLRVWG